MDFAKQTLEKIKLESLIPYLDNTVYLIAFLVILSLLIYNTLYCIYAFIKII